ncbi:MAG: bifunctional 4-hydroxy-2-oxoglutarate aldolase/2-dehydro-3-deoxy-phosphogluconate aldolase [Anaerolineaceae bacterium]|nr:bifunctional 4-hydroxy-2-oxoglutarate aldolase/2-dehydro-3-deoxy-phosphogluconate aldolase [Anaerolineaceae bacterium]
MNVLEQIGNIGLVPVVVIENAEDAVLAAKALLDAHLGIMEITMRTAAGIQAIKNVRAACPNMLVGAGTILSLEKCKEAVDAGAQFIVSPGINPVIVEWCVKNDIVVTPGCVTPTEIDTALSFGIRIVKFFPADVYGGVNACNALYGPYKSAGIKFIPTGGVNNDNLPEFADKPFIHAVGGGWLCKTSDITNHNFALITENAKKAIDVLLGFEVAHVGINQDTPEASLSTAGVFNKAFNFPIKEGNSSNMVSSFIEITKTKYLGTCGHLAVKTNSISRAIYYLQQKGFEIDLATAKYKGDNMIAVYLKGEFGGFAVHLLQK